MEWKGLRLRLIQLKKVWFRLPVALFIITYLILLLKERSSDVPNLSKRAREVEVEEEYLMYEPPIAPDIKGQPFYSVNASFALSLLPIPIKLTPDDLDQFVFVTAITGQYYQRVTRLIASVQKHFPRIKPIVYDLELTDLQVQKLSELCMVEVRKFPFKKYPGHVSRIHSYAFKPLILAEVFKDDRVKGVFWADSSIRLKTNDTSHLHKVAMRSDGMAAFTGTGHSVFAVTIEEMFHYLPMVKDPRVKECIVATAILMYRTEKVVNDVLKWWVACALSKECIWNRAYSNCPFTQRGQNRWTEFGHCSRYDQSALSIILYNAYADSDDFLAYRLWKYLHGSFLDIVRSDRMSYEAKTCRILH